MASTSQNLPTTSMSPLSDGSNEGPSTLPQALAQSVDPVESSTPLEMSNLSKHQVTTEVVDTAAPQIEPAIAKTNPYIDPTSQPNLQSSTAQPSQEASTMMPSDAPADPGKILLINLLLLNGNRHPYKIDKKYLARRNIHAEDDNPLNLTIYTLKELIWRDWRDEWEPRPTTPGMIRLIHAGHMPDEKMKLGDRFIISPHPQIVHMSVRPQDTGDDEDAGKTPTRDRADDGPSPRCRCCTIM